MGLAANSKAKSDAYSLMTSTAAAVKELQGKLNSGNVEVSADASIAQKDLKKALDSPFSKNALEKVEKGRSEMKLATTDTADLKLQFESAQQTSAAAKKAYFQGMSTNWGQNPVAAPAAPAAAAKSVEFPSNPSKEAAPVQAAAAGAAAAAAGGGKKEVFKTGDRSLSNDEEAEKPKVSAVSKEQVEKDADEGKEPDYSKMTDAEVAYWLAKPMHYADSEPESPQKVEGNIFAVKEDETEQIRILRSLAKTSALDISAHDQAAMQSGRPQVVNGTILDTKKDAAMLNAKPKIPELAPGESVPQPQTDKHLSKPLTVLEVKMAQDENTEHSENQMKQAKAAAGTKSEAEQAKKPEDEKKPSGADQEVTQIEQAKVANPTPESKDNKPDAPAKKEVAALTGKDNEVAQTKEAIKAAKTNEVAIKAAKTKPDMGESDSDFDNEISADRVLEDSEIGDSAEGIDEANADSELDDVSVQNEDDEDDDDDDDDDIDDEDE